MEETNTPMFKSTRSMENQMDEILSVEKDPVSGNTAPLGATPAEVRDDIPIMASPNEFMIDAATRRYYGTPFFENLQAAAKQGFQRIKKGEESFFRDDELEIEEASKKVISDDSPQQMQEGGEVQEVPGENVEVPPPMGGGYGPYGGVGPMFTGFEFKMYIDPDTGKEIQIVFFNGRPLTPIPSGYILKGATPLEVREQTESTKGGGNGDRPDPPKTWRNTPVTKWDDGMFRAYSQALQSDPNAGLLSGLERGFLQFAGNLLIPGVGGFALEKLAKKENKKIAEAVVERSMKYLSTGLDEQGNKLSQGALSMYNQARINANFALSRLSDTGGPFAADSEEAQEIIAQQQQYIQTLREGGGDGGSDDGGPGVFYGGTEETETALIQDEDLTDDEFWEEFEAGTPGGVGNVYGN